MVLHKHFQPEKEQNPITLGAHNRIHTDVCLGRNSKGRCLVGRCMQDCGGGNLMEKDHLEDTDFDGKIILQCNFKK